ncbi:thiamine pyrophosphate-binding protein [Fictibacillus norfolkensis]|uniref:Thiamine pyrophosphate-binding protein n=1 Tax=Fictibacillus norfolkensis TaxID=2762233 RepID=A0ABR8SHT9_9BACL|nr:thiamine pyrophosphate-binding protein [Fictibacillus norfolkensis]MBD7963042.1 thiamine pyrophosphate-binding protein [Fictibacillus norfolkensis]
MNKQTVWEKVASCLSAYGTEIVFGLPSDDLKLLQCIEEKEMEFFSAKDQSNSLYMATGYSLATGRLSVCHIGKGPAVASSITGVLEASSQSIPLLIIATATDTNRYGSKKAFQEADQLKLISPLTKWSHRVESAESVGWVLKKAIFTAINGSQGPVYIEIPENIGSELVDEELFSFKHFHVSDKVPSSNAIHNAQRLIQNARNPVILAGGGCKRSTNRSTITQLAELIDAPIFVTASGRGCVDEDHPLFCGLGGLYSSSEMDTLIKECDLFLSLGSKLEETVLFGWEEHLLSRNMIEINIDENDFNLSFDSLKLVGEVGSTLDILLETIEPSFKVTSQNKVSIIKTKLHEQKQEILQRDDELKVIDILEEMETVLAENSILVHENGLQDMWSYFYPNFKLRKKQNAIVPSEQTSLGFGCGAAVGVKKAHSDCPVIALVGDGAFNLFSVELATLITQKIPILYVVLKNGGYGWLEFQNNSQETSFVDSSLSLVSIDHEQLFVLPLVEKNQLRNVFSESIKKLNEGKTVVIEATVHLNDVPSALSELYGDFPVKEVVQ